MEYQTKFGNPDAFDTMMGHISTMSRDIALMEILGPNPRSTINFMKTTIAKRAAGNVAEESRANRAGKKLEDLYMAATGNVNTPVGGGRFAATMAGRRLYAIEALGSTHTARDPKILVGASIALTCLRTVHLPRNPGR